MFSELPNFFDRNFIIAFFFPSVIFVIVGLELLISFDVEPNIIKTISDDIFKGATAIGVISFAISISLLSLKFSVLRFFEGYGKFNPLRLLRNFHYKKFDLINKTKQELKSEKLTAESKSDSEKVDEIQNQRNALYKHAAEHYPKKRNRVLPTLFGNTIRAFEEYSEEMYGLDAIISWVRLLAVIPKDFREMINSAKSQVDLWLNLQLLSIILLIAYLVLVFINWEFKILWFPLSLIGFAYFASRKSISSAVMWGDFVKSSYDLFLPNLREQIKLPETQNVEEERQIWNKFARQVIYHSQKNVSRRVQGKKMLDTKNEGSS